MRSHAVLTLGSYDNKELIDTLYGIGLSPLVQDSTSNALNKLRHDRFSAIIVDVKNAKDDVLELLCNIRDINEEITVVVLGLKDHTVQEALLTLKRVIIIEDTSNENELAGRLEKILINS